MITNVFQNGNSQAVRIPTNFRLNTKTVEILQGQNGDIILRPIKPKEKSTAELDFLSLFSDIDADFIETLEKRDLSTPQEREIL